MTGQSTSGRAWRSDGAGAQPGYGGLAPFDRVGVVVEADCLVWNFLVLSTIGAAVPRRS
jgi:hypothetical protein